MPILVNDPDIAERIRAEREAAGADGYDEVWEGVYVVPLMPNDEHQDVAGGFYAVFKEVLGSALLTFSLRW